VAVLSGGRVTRKRKKQGGNKKGGPDRERKKRAITERKVSKTIVYI